MEASLFPDINPNIAQNVSSHNPNKTAPLAYQLAPQSIDDYAGQRHLVGPGKPLRKWIESDHISSMILWGPPGVGKTALARLISKSSHSEFISLNAVMAKVQDIRASIIKAEQNHLKSKRTILFIDEIHRFNKAQQDALLPDLEKGTIILIGATTENPHFSVNPSILSRSQVFELESLRDDDLRQVISRALTHPRLANISPIDPEIETMLIRQSHGDARRLINLLEALANAHESDTHVERDHLEELIQHAGALYREDEHYDIISAFIKSVRGSDTDAALYWLSRMIKGGEDPRFIARRLLILASEDIGLADPHALPLAVSALQTVQFIGFPEAKYTLSHITIYLAKAPKSNSATTAISKSLAYVSDGHIHPVPLHLKDAHYKGAKESGRGEGYQYPHNFPDAKVDQRYWDGDTTFYTPTNRDI